MNTMDLVPVDWLPVLAQKIGGLFGADPHHVYLKVVPTTDPNMTFGMSIGIFLLILFYSVKEKGLGVFVGKLTFKPFVKWMLPAKLTLDRVNLMVKPASIPILIFGHMSSAEMNFLLRALFPLWLRSSSSLPWAIFHILIVTLQAFIFMTLVIVYMDMAHQKEH